MKQTTKRPKRILALLVLAVVCGSVGPIVFFWCLPSSSSVATGGASSLLSEYYAAEFEMVMSVMSSSSKSVPRVSSHPRYGSSNRNVTTIDTTRKNHDNNKKKNLAVLGAAGRQSTIPVILHNVYTHFYDNSWDILIFCYTLEAFDFISTNLTSATTTTSTSIPKPRRFSSSTNSTSMTTILVPTTSSSSIITATSSTNHDEVSQYYRNITVFFGKGYQYGDFIQGHLFPSDLYMKQTYQYVSLILDDARIGNNYSVDGMLEFMVKHELDVATSVIEGVSEKWGRSDNEVYPGRRKKLLHNLLNNNALSASERTNPDLLASAINGTGRLVQTWEIFVTFFTADAFLCMLEYASPENHHFHGMAACYFPYCSRKQLGRIGVKDDESNARHLEKTSDNVKKVATNFKLKWAEKGQFYSHLKQLGVRCLADSKTLGWI